MNKQAKKILKWGSLFVFFILIGIYAFFRSHDLVFGVKIKNVNLQDGIKVSGSVFEITGNAKNATNLTLNGREISIDQGGDFDETIAFLSGYNVLEIKAQDKFGHVDQKNYKVMYIE